LLLLGCKTMKIENTRRLSDRVPLGVESALPVMPGPELRTPARKRRRGWRKFALAVAALLFFLGVWLVVRT